MGLCLVNNSKERGGFRVGLLFLSSHFVIRDHWTFRKFVYVQPSETPLSQASESLQHISTGLQKGSILNFVNFDIFGHTLPNKDTNILEIYNRLQAKGQRKLKFPRITCSSTYSLAVHLGYSDSSQPTV